MKRIFFHCYCLVGAKRMPRVAVIRAFFFLIALALFSYGFTGFHNGSEAESTLKYALQEKADREPSVAGSAKKLGEYVPGQLIIKFKKEAGTRFRKAQKLGNMGFHGVEGDIGFENLVLLNKNFQIAGWEPLYPELSEVEEGARSNIEANVFRNLERAQRRQPGAHIPALEDTYIFRFPKDADMEVIAYEYSKDPNIEYASPDYILGIAAEPNDPYWYSSGSWGQDYQDLYGLHLIRSAGAWDISQGGDVIVAVIDTGIDIDHEDLAGKVWINEEEIPDNGIDDDRNGFVDDVWGWDFVNEDAEPMDGHGHGTHCAGTIAATTNNGIGVAALLWYGKVMAIKGLSDSGRGSSSRLARAIKYATDMGADVLSNSWGATGYEKGVTIPPIAEAIEYAYASGCVFVAAAGNSYGDVSYVFPANHQLSIAVAAIDWENRKPAFSCFGTDVDVAAPGVNVLSLYAANSPMGRSRLVGEKYCYVSGTSMACPHVAGVAALILAKNPDITNDQVRQILRASAALPPEEESKCVGRGILDAQKALEIDIPPSGTAAEITSPKYEQYARTNSLQIVGTAIGNQYELEYNSAFYRPDGWELIAAGNANIEEGVLANWNISELPESSYVLRLSVYWGDSENSPPLRAYSSFILDRMIKSGWESSPAIEKSFWTSPLVADFDGDGLKEILVADANEIFMYTFDGKIAQGWPLTVGGNNLRLSAHAAADLDNDGDLEVIFTSTDRIWAMHHDGTMVTGWPVQRFFMLQHIAVADLTGDGDVEIVGGWRTSNPDGSNVASSIAVFNADGTIEEGWPIQLYGYYPTAGFAVGDIDQDGKDEIAFAIAGRGLYVYNDDGTSCDGWPQRWHDSYHSATAPIMADFDYDGEVEILFVEQSEVRIYESDGTLMPGWPYELFFQLHAPAACGDLDGDGDLEIIFGPGIRAETANKLYALHHNGTPVAGWPVVVEGEEPFSSGFRRPGAAIADLDRDGRQEVVFPSSKISPVNVYVFRDNGMRVPPWPKQVGDATVALETCPAVSDLEDDGRMEVIVATVTRGLVVWEIEPTGTEAARFLWPTEGQNISRTNYIAPTRSPNRAPSPPTLNGPTSGVAGQALVFSAVATDPDGDSVKYTFDWGDGTTTTTPLTGSGIKVSAAHTWQNEGTYSVRVQAVDAYAKPSPWSKPLSLTLAKPAPEVVTTTTANTYSFFGYNSAYKQTAQSFKAVGNRISAVSVALSRRGQPNMDIVCHIRERLSGPDLGNAVIANGAITSTDYRSPTWVTVSFPNGVNVVEGKTYFIVLTVSKTNVLNYYSVPLNRNNPYPDGQWYKGSVGRRQASYDMLVKITF